MALLRRSFDILVFVGTAFGATCEELATLKLPNTTIVTAQSVAAGAFTPPSGSAAPYKDLPAFCRIAGVISPTTDSEIKFEVWMPAANWNGKFHGIGNGGFAGSISYRRGWPAHSREGTPALRPTRVMAEGMQAGLSDILKSWQITATARFHEMTEKAKLVVKAFYGKVPSARILPVARMAGGKP